jgi:hypothetical protein
MSHNSGDDFERERLEVERQRLELERDRLGFEAGLAFAHNGTTERLKAFLATQSSGVIFPERGSRNVTKY